MIHTTHRTSLKAVGIIGATLLVGLLTACTTDGNSTYVRMCENKSTQQRASDSACVNAPATVKNNDDSTDAFLWYYVLYSNTYSAPAVGSRLTSGTTEEPEDGEEIDENIDEEGGEIDENDITQEEAPETDTDNNSVNNDDDSGDDDSGNDSSFDDDSGADDDSAFSDAGDDD